MATTTLLLEIASGLLFAAAGIAVVLVGSALVLGAMIAMDGEQRVAPVRVPPSLPPPRRLYGRALRGSSTSRTASPSTFTARIRPNNADAAASRFHQITGSRASSSRA